MTTPTTSAILGGLAYSQLILACEEIGIHPVYVQVRMSIEPQWIQRGEHLMWEHGDLAYQAVVYLQYPLDNIEQTYQPVVGRGPSVKEAIADLGQRLQRDWHAWSKYLAHVPAVALPHTRVRGLLPTLHPSLYAWPRKRKRPKRQSPKPKQLLLNPKKEPNDP